jgi:phosphoglycerate dehydrogenase-like enzyme
MRAHLLHAPADDALTTLRSSLPASVTLGMGRPVSPDADILVAGVPSAADLDASSRLSALVIPYAGLPTSTRALLAERPGLSVYNLHHNAPAVAEMALALLLAVTRHLMPMASSAPRLQLERPLPARSSVHPVGTDGPHPRRTRSGRLSFGHEVGPRLSCLLTSGLE